MVKIIKGALSEELSNNKRGFESKNELSMIRGDWLARKIVWSGKIACGKWSLSDDGLGRFQVEPRLLEKS